MPTPVRARLMLAFGVIMMALGLFLGARPLLSPGRPLTSSRWLDLVFALFFVVRGLMNIRASRRYRARGAAPGSVDPPPSERR